MHVAIVTTYPPGKGSLNEYAYHFVRALRQKSEVGQVTLLVDELPDGVPYPSASSELEEAPLHIVPCWRFDDVRNAWRIGQVVRQYQPDVVLFNLQFATFGAGKVPASLGLLAPKLVNLAGFPTMVLLHNIMETVDLRKAGFASQPIMEKVIRIAGNLVTRAILSVDKVAVTIPKYVEILTAKYHTDKVLLAPHGTFEEHFPEPTFELPPGPRQIMAFGKFGTYKKVEILLDALRILEQGGRSDLEVVIAGTDSPNAPGYLQSVQAQYADLPNVRFTGYVAEEEVPRIFGEAAVAVFPYTSTTGSSGVLHQAGSYARAAVLPRIGDFAEVITEEGYDGEFFTPDDAPSLAQAIANILDNDDRRRELGMRNYMAACGLPISDVVDWYVLHFDSIIAAHRRRSAPDDQAGTAGSQPRAARV